MSVISLHEAIADLVNTHHLNSTEWHVMSHEVQNEWRTVVVLHSGDDAYCNLEIVAKLDRNENVVSIEVDGEPGKCIVYNETLHQQARREEVEAIEQMLRTSIERMSETFASYARSRK